MTDPYVIAGLIILGLGGFIVWLIWRELNRFDRGNE